MYDVVPEFKVKVAVSNALTNHINGKVPGFKEILNEANKEIFYEIRILTTSEYNNATHLEHVDKIFKIIGFLKKKKNIANPSVYYIVSTDEKNKDSIQYICWLDEEKTKSINVPSEIIQYFERY